MLHNKPTISVVYTNTMSPLGIFRAAVAQLILAGVGFRLLRCLSFYDPGCRCHSRLGYTLLMAIGCGTESQWNLPLWLLKLNLAMTLTLAHIPLIKASHSQAQC